MKKTKTSIGRASLLLLAVVLVAIPLLGVACSDEDGFKAQFTASPQSGDAPLTVTFTNKSKGDIIGWEWDFDGDGEVDSTEQNPTHTYYTPDQWTVSLVVTNTEQQVDKEIKESYINTTGVVYETMNLVMNNPYHETETTGKAAAKFKELIEMYTGGNVTVTIHYATLLQHHEQFEGLQSEAIDVCLNHGAMVRHINPNFSPLQPLRGMVLDFGHGQAIASDQWVNQFMVDEYAEYGIRYLGFVDWGLFGGYLNQSGMQDYVDLDGVKLGWFTPGPLDPWENLFGAVKEFVTETDVATKIAMGQVEAVGFPVTQAWASGFYAMFNSYIMIEIYFPIQMLMSEATWNSMSPDLQELITDTVMPELQEYATSVAIEDHKAAAKGLKDAMESMYSVDLDRIEEAWEMVEQQADFQALKASYDPELIARIEALRPTQVARDPVIAEILTYAGF